jgi:hypothetical protein
LIVLGVRDGELQRSVEVTRAFAPDVISRVRAALTGAGTVATQLTDTVSDRVQELDTDQIAGAFGGLRDSVLDKVPLNL